MDTLETLLKLNQEASIPNNGYNSIDWTKKIDHNKFWFPEHLTPFYYLPIFSS